MISQSKEKVITCTCIGQIMRPAGQKWSGEVINARLVGKQLLLYFKNGFTCSNVTCKIVEDKKEKEK